MLQCTAQLEDRFKPHVLNCATVLTVARLALIQMPSFSHNINPMPNLAVRLLQLDLDWAFQLKDGVPQLNRQSLIPGGSVELTHENLFGDSQSLSLSLSSSDWRNPAADLGFQMSYTEPFYAKNTTRNLQVSQRGDTTVVGLADNMGQHGYV